VGSAGQRRAVRKPRARPNGGVSRPAPPPAAALYRAVLQTTLDGCVVADLSGRILDVNDVYARMSGYSRAELLRMRVSEIEISESPQDVAAHLAKLARLGSDRFETLHRRKDGSTYPAEISVQLLRRPQRFLALVRDLSERHRAMRALRESEQRFQLFMDHFPGLAYIKDERLAVLFANLGFQRYLGISPAAIAGKQGDEFFPSEFAAAIAADDGQVLASGQTREVEESFAGRIWATHKFPIPRADAPPLLGGVTLDITARRQAEEALRQSNWLLLEAQRVAHLGAYDLDVLAGVWSSSPVLDEIFGIDAGHPRDVAGWLAIVHPEERDEMRRYFAEHVIGARRRFDKEYRILRPSDSQERWVHGRGQLFFDLAGRPLRMVGTIQDITERRQREQEKLELERRLLHAQKLESLGVLAGGIAHDFNNLLMSILGNLDLALLKLPDPEAARASVEQAVSAVRRSADLARQMLAYAGRAPFVIAALDLNVLVRENAELLRTTVARSIALELRLAPQLPRVRADAAQIQQLVMNLITNAAEAIGDAPGVITLRTGVAELDAAALARNRLGSAPPAGRYAYVEVADTGVGMDAETQRRIFEPFFTTKLHGRGLGMAVAHGVVRGHEGALFVDSAAGAGTTVRALFPAHEAAPEPREPPLSGTAPEPSPPDALHGTVLLVDDEDLVRSVVQQLLEHFGLAVLATRDGQEGVELFRRHAEQVACVLLDLSMPRMDGLAALREMARIKPGVKGHPRERLRAAGRPAPVRRPGARGLHSEALRRARAVRDAARHPRTFDLRLLGRPPAARSRASAETRSGGRMPLKMAPGIGSAASQTHFIEGA
jgi:PAS domain S-box-containing protein